MFSAVMTRVRALLQRRRAAREMDDELRFHLEMEIEANIARGVPPREARRLALSELGGLTQTREAIGEVRMLSVEWVWQDVRHASRSLRSRPGVTLAAVAMIALAIGITTAMFAVMDSLILRPVPFHEPEQLASVMMRSERGGRLAVAPAVLRAWRETPAFDGAESARADTALLEHNGTVVARGIARVTPGIFGLLGNVRPIRGRLFADGEGRAGQDDRVLLSEDLWRGLFGADPAILGRRVLVDDDPVTVIGILPSDFRFPSWNTVIWRPVDFDAPPPARADDLAAAYVRFAAGLPRADALRLATDAARLADPANAQLWAWARPLAGMELNDYGRRAVPLLAGGVALVFLVLCANVASLLLARLTARQREFSMCSALGASRGRLMRQAFAESVIIGCSGVFAGIMLASALVALARAFLPEAFLLRSLNPLNVDSRAIIVTAAAGVMATLAAGLLPAWIGTRADAGAALRVVDRAGTASRGARALTRGLLVAEIALACTLLVGATLLVRSFVNLARAERGIDVSGLVTATISLPRTAFPDAPTRMSAAEQIEAAVRAVPGVDRVAWSYGLPPGGGGLAFGEWEGDVPGSRPVNMEVESYSVGPEFFSLYGIPLLRGRTFGPSDPDDTHVIVGERFARALWGDADPVGRAFNRGRERFTVIGLAREIHHPSLDATLDRPEFYQPFGGVGNYAMMSIRCVQSCPDVARLRQRLKASHPAVQVVEVRPLEDVYFEQLARPRATAAVAFAFAAIAILAAAGGLFSVLTFAVGQRRREFGIRTALGASPVQIRRLVLRDGLLVAIAGMALGSAAAWGAGRALASMQYGVTLSDPLSWLVVLVVLAGTTAAASWRPAREASRVDPVLLLRAD